MEIRGSRELEQDIARLEKQRNQAIEAERREEERQLEAEKAAGKAEREAEARAVQQRIAIAERKRDEDIQRDLAWWGKIKETCFVEATNPLFKSWGLCQSFLDEQRQGGFCDQCQYGYQNEAWLKGYVHKERAREPC